MPVQRKVVENWNFDCLGYEANSNGEVTLIFCKICREFSKLEDVKRRKSGVAKLASEKFVAGTSIIKKNNFKDHVLISKTHATAVLRIAEKEKQKTISKNVETGVSSQGSSSESSAATTSTLKQRTIVPFIQELNKQQRQQLVKKMQIAHFTVSNAKLFSFYGELSKFCSNTLNVSALLL